MQWIETSYYLTRARTRWLTGNRIGVTSDARATRWRQYFLAPVPLNRGTSPILCASQNVCESIVVTSLEMMPTIGTSFRAAARSRDFPGDR